jgi:hypothetical protein
MRCPTAKLKHKVTGEVITVNEYDYATGLFSHLCGLDGSGAYERVGSTHGGGDEGYKASKVNSDIALEVKTKRKNDNLGKKIIF